MVETRMVIVSCPKRRDAEELRKWCFSRWGSRVRKLNPVSPVRKQDSGGYSFHLKLAGQYEEFSEDLNLLEKNYTGQCRITCLALDERGRPKEDRTRDFPVHDSSANRKRRPKL
jgi:hypothetical protein